jgi:F-type H+-transporting ATPase subunit c
MGSGTEGVPLAAAGASIPNEGNVSVPGAGIAGCPSGTEDQKRGGKSIMKKTLAEAVGILCTVLFSASLAAAAEAAAPGSSVDYTKAIVVGCSLIAVGIAMGLGTIGTGIGMGHGLSGATNAVGRNPEAQGKVLLTMMVGLAMIESLAIYALVISLVVLYANPLLKVIGL